MTGARECPASANASNACVIDRSASRVNTEPRGTITSRSSRVSISKTPVRISRCSTCSIRWLLTRFCSSSRLMVGTVAPGVTPNRRTTALLATPNTATTGRDSREARSIGPAATSAHGRARCIAIRLGASSPRTRVTKVSARVTPATATGSAALAQDGQVGHQGLGQGHRCSGGGEEPGQGDPDLDRGQEAVGVTRQAHQPHRPGGALSLQLGELSLPQRDQRHLAAGEGRVDQHQQPDQGEVHPVAVHGSSSGQL